LKRALIEAMAEKVGTIFKRIAVLGILAACLTLCAAFFTACNRGEAEPEYEAYDHALYLSGYNYSESDGIVYAIVTLSGKDEKKLDTTAFWETKLYRRNKAHSQSEWYNTQDVFITVNSAELYREVSENTPPETMIFQDKEYNRLKVILRYDTIYKSITSGAEIERSGKYYLHRFRISEEESSETFALMLVSQNAASWYSILIVSVLITAVLATAIALALKGKYGKRTKTKQDNEDDPL